MRHSEILLTCDQEHSIIPKMSVRKAIRISVAIMIVSVLLGRSSMQPGDQIERVRAFTRSIEFDYITWTIDAFGVKLGQSALNLTSYLPVESETQIVRDFLQLVRSIQETEAQLELIYTDPNVDDPRSASEDIRNKLSDLIARRELIGPLAESIFQAQINETLSVMGVTLNGQALPPVLYHSTPLPFALIVSPRDVIRQDANISLITDLHIDDRVALETEVDRELNVSSLVVPVGGVGTYPTMVAQTTNLNWLADVVAHEWAHNFLTLRPLGLNYNTSPQLRTINETTASIVGGEVGAALIETYYPDLVPPPPPVDSGEIEAPLPPVFDFRAEMRLTRVTVDELLANGEIETAEEYMESRRIFFWENGYHIRKLNQAYFAFHGAYADQPGGAAGDDPVGEAVRRLRAQSDSLANFLNRIAWVSSFSELLALVNN